MVQVRGKPTNVDDALEPLEDALTRLLRGSEENEMRQMAALLTVVSHRFDVMRSVVPGEAPRELSELQDLIEFWLREHRQVIAQENLRVRVDAREFANAPLPGEDPEAER